MTGHVRRRGERSWELKFDLGTDPATGKRLTRYHSFKGTKREAEAELTRLKAGADRGEYVDPAKTTLSEFLDRWERDWAAHNVSPKTLERYAELLRLHVRPYLGGARLQKLRPVHFTELQAKLLREGRKVRPPTEDGRAPEPSGLSGRTVGHIHRLLHHALGHALQWGLITVNPMSGVDSPTIERTEIEILTAEQAGALLTALKGRAFYPIASLALATGMRRGELCGLRWKDVDLDGASLRVEQSVEETKAGLRFKSPKTRHGRRTISLPASAVADLRAHWRSQQELRLKLGLGKAPEDALVFQNFDGSTRKPNALTKEWKRVLAALKLPKVSLHALRHTHASQLIDAAMDVLSISRRLGHGSPTITLEVYGHRFKNNDKTAADVIEAMFAKMPRE